MNQDNTAVHTDAQPAAPTAQPPAISEPSLVDKFDATVAAHPKTAVAVAVGVGIGVGVVIAKCCSGSSPAVDAAIESVGV